MSVMPFGKHRGELLSVVPLGYLAWCLEECDLRPALDHAIREEIADRIGASRGRAAITTLALPPALAPVVRDLVKCGFRHLARERHPDVGGSNLEMRRVLEAHQWLETVLA